MRLLRLATITVQSLAIIACAAAAARALPGHEAQLVVDQLLAPPTIKAEEGFSARVLVPPGEFYDPLLWFSEEILPSHKASKRLIA